MITDKETYKTMQKETKDAIEKAKLEKLNKQIWKESKSASKYPKDYLVIPALDVTVYLEQAYKLGYEKCLKDKFDLEGEVK